MSQIEKKLQKIKQEKRLGIMTHIVVGYPNLLENKKLIRLMAKSGVDFIELQIPFSDPMADGPTIMRANKRALDNGTKVQDAFNLMHEMSSEINIPLLFMGYFNTVLNYGTEKFCQAAAQAGCSGLIFPDISLEEESQEHFMEYAQKYKLNHIRVLSPASTVERIKKNTQFANGFVYFVGIKGTTGTKVGLDKSLVANLKKVKKFIKTPIAVGFGISNAEHIKVLKGKAEVVVIGSAMLDKYANAKTGEGLKEVESLLKSFVVAAKNNI